jgi:predicted dehydrogenase
MTLRIGTLGAAKITPNALIKPARRVEGVAVTAIAARDATRARTFAAKHGIPSVHGSYEALLADPEIDAVYVPLPNALHAPWTLAAVAAGKHVLCEKPFTSNAVEAQHVAEVAEKSGLVVMEAFHYRYHPLALRARTILDSGEIGAVRHVETSLCFPLPKSSDIRWQLPLAGGATMDAGCYAIHALRTFGSGEPEVIEARAKLRRPGVDRYMTASFRYPDGSTGRMTASMWSARLLSIGVRVVGEAGELRILNYVLPHAYHRLTVQTAGVVRRERVPGETSYTHQLRAFGAAVVDGAPVLTTPADAVVTMRLIDEVYLAAGLAPRGVAAH